MQKQNGGRPTILPKMYEEPLFSQIIDKIESGCGGGNVSVKAVYYEYHTITMTDGKGTAYNEKGEEIDPCRAGRCDHHQGKGP